VQAALNAGAPFLAPVTLESSVESDSAVARETLRESNRAAAIKARLDEVQAEKVYRKANVFSYQAVFSRNITQVCTANSGTIVFPNTTTTAPFDQSNLTFCHARTGGPVIIIAKTTTPVVTTDSFDGDHNGVDDVLQAFNNLAAKQTVGQKNEGKKKKTPTEDTLIATFLHAVRNRATVNGGSIGLKALIVTGRQATKHAPFAVFGGTTDRILISPCFPVERNVALADEGVARSRPFTNYNFEFVGVASGWNGLFDVVPQVNYTTFVATPGATQATDVMATQTASFNLVMSAFPNPNTTRGGIVQAGVILGQVFFQKCTQFSYFA